MRACDELPECKKYSESKHPHESESAAALRRALPVPERSGRIREQLERGLVQLAQADCGQSASPRPRAPSTEAFEEIGIVRRALYWRIHRMSHHGCICNRRGFSCNAGQMDGAYRPDADAR
jgi:hypothetical protein